METIGLMDNYCNMIDGAKSVDGRTSVVYSLTKKYVVCIMDTSPREDDFPHSRFSQ